MGTEILWRVHVWRGGKWWSWCGDSGNVRLRGMARDEDAEKTQRCEAERIAAQGKVVCLSRLGAPIQHWNTETCPSLTLADLCCEMVGP